MKIHYGKVTLQKHVEDVAKYLIFLIDFPFVTAVTDRINGEQAALLLLAVDIEGVEEGKIDEKLF